MNTKTLVWAGVILAVQLGVCSLAESGTVTWSVKNGGTVVCEGTGNNTANLPATCGSDLDFVGSGGTARIEAIDTGTNDILQLMNTKIVAKKNLTDYVLTFDHTFTPGPTKNDYSPIYYRTHMYGTYISGLAPDNKITVTSTVEHPVGTPLLNAAPTPAPPPQLNFNYYDSPNTTTDMNGDRKIIVKVKFSLQDTKYINFGVGRFVKVIAQSFPDPPDSERPQVDSSSLLSEVEHMIESGGTACVGVSLRDGSCAGIHIVK